MGGLQTSCLSFFIYGTEYEYNQGAGNNCVYVKYCILVPTHQKNKLDSE
jgi:hypothetical protein